MENQFERTEKLIGEENIKKLHNSKIAIFGIGGVGSYVVEALARVGIGEFILVDNDKITVSNINRQIHAMHDTVGNYKVDEMEKRILKINPNASVKTYKTFFMPNSEEIILDNSINYIVDAIDTVTAKIELVKQAQSLEIPIISSMGTGNKLDPTKVQVTDLSKTTVCPLAKVMRKELRKIGIKHLKVVYSIETPIKTEDRIPGSVSFVPSVAGLMIAGEIVKDIIERYR